MPETDVTAVVLDERSGAVRMAFGSETYTLLPPTLGKLRALYEVANQIDEAVSAAAAEDAAENVGAEGAALLKLIGGAWLAEDGGLEYVLRWWAKCFELCEADAKPLPPPDECPVWLGAMGLHIRVLTHWLQFPTLALGTSALRAASTPTNGA